LSTDTDPGPVSATDAPTVARITAAERHGGATDGREPLGEVGVERGLGQGDEAPTGTDRVVEPDPQAVGLGLDEQLPGAR
jgi:hypothetical protein